MIIRPGALFDGERIARGVAARIEGGRVCELSESLAPRADETVLDAPDALLSPGFIDLHIHGIAGCDAMRGETDVKKMAERLPAHGVTGFLPTTMAAPIGETRAALAGVASAKSHRRGARVLGCHLEGPFLNPARKGAQPQQFIVPPSLEVYDELTEGLAHVVKLMTLAPEMTGAAGLIEALRFDVALSAGHTDAGAEQLERAAALGLTQVTHMFNGMNALNHRAPGVPGAALTLDALSVQLIADLLHLHRLALALCYRAKGAARCLLITDAMEAADMPDGEYALGANRVFVRAGEARLADGTLAGSTLTMERAVRNMVEAAGVPPEHALRMATLNPARAIGSAGGVLRAGAPADLTLLGPDYSVRLTLVGGATAFKNDRILF